MSRMVSRMRVWLRKSPKNGKRAMSIIATTCRGCDAEFEPGREAIVAGTWQFCPACRGSEDAPRGPGVCPQCHRVLKSGTHRGPCPGRQRRNQEVRS
jgi:hypothetical protein